MAVKRVITGTLSLLVIALVMAPSLMAQSLVSGDLTGTVTDPSGAVVSSATVTLKNNGTGAARTTTTSASGTYRFALLSPGNYTVSVVASGFSKAESQTSVNVGQATIADMKMAIGSSSQTVEVSGAAPLVQSDNADLSTNFDQNMIANSPNGGNDITYVAQTAPGVNMNTGMGYGNFQTSGLPATSNVFTVNGENDMDPFLNLNNSGATNLTLGKSDLQEATVITNAYSGQYGQQAGVQVNYVTKSGTNQYHGNAEYWWTGRALDANDYFNNLSGTSRPFANNNEWADSFGGPIKKDKLFFFVDNEGIRYIVPSSQTVFSPTVAFANSTLANIAATNPAELPLYSKMFSLYQAAPGYSRGVAVPGGGCEDFTFAGNCFQQYSATPALPGTEYIISGRVDYNLSDKDHLFWRVRMDHGTQATYADPINSAFDAASYQPAYDGQGQWSHVFSPNATNNFVYAGSYYRAIFTQTNDANSVFPTQLLMTPLGYTNLGGNLANFPQGRNVTQYQFVDDFSWTKGAHSLKFGGNFRRYDITDYTFSVLNNPLSVITSVTGFYNGIAGEFLQNFPSRATEPVALWGIGLYAQDEWRVNKSLKLTLALRGEHNSNPTCNLNCASYLSDPFAATSTDLNTPYNQMISSNLGNVFRGTDTINWAPRFGFAWSPGGSDKTVVRGGFGIFYDAFPSIYADNSMTNLPNQVNETLVGPGGIGVPWADQTTPAGAWQTAASSAAAIKAGFAGGASFNSLTAGLPGFSAPSFNSFVGTFHTPRYQEWSLQLEQQLDDKSSFTLAYVGNHGINIPITNYPNAFAGVAGLPAAPFSGSFATVAEVYSGAVSNFNGLTASYNRRLTYGFTVQASYTWSHSMDDVSNNGVEQTPYSSTTVAYQINPFCLQCSNYGNSDYDIRNSFNASFVWKTPFKFSNKFANGAFGGWTLSQNFFARSGLPLTVLDSSSGIGNYFGNAPYFPAEVTGAGQGNCNQYGTGCLVASGFAPASGLTVFPNQIRNQYRGPGFFDSDFTINKNFKLTERMAFGLGANFYNVFNHPNFAQPVDTFSAGNFGQILTTTAPPTGPYGAFFQGLPSGRIIQFQGKLVF
jgi:hypothetical protein